MVFGLGQAGLWAASEYRYVLLLVLARSSLSLVQTSAMCCVKCVSSCWCVAAAQHARCGNTVQDRCGTTVMPIEARGKYCKAPSCCH